MKKFTLVTVMLILASLSYGQADMKSIWETELEHKGEVNEFDESTEQMMCTSEKMISLVDTKTGKIKWSKDFKTLTNGLLKKVDERIPMWDAKCIFLFDRKGGKDQMAVIDLENGNMLWNTNKYEDVTESSIAYVAELGMFAVANKKAFTMIKARSGEEVWETQGFKGALAKYIYNKSDNTIVALNYNPAAAGKSILGGIGKLAANLGGFKSQIYKLNVKNGEVLWQTDIKGSIEREIATGKILASMKMIGTKVLLTMQGLQAYDLNNGSLVWSVTHSEEVMREISGGIGAGYTGRKFVRKAVYGAVAEPLIDGNDVYVFDMQSKKQQYVSKYDLNTGKLIWKSKELKKLTIAPNLYKVGNRIVIQIGGWAQVQGIVENKQSYGGGFGAGGFSMSTYEKVKFYKEFGPFGVEALDATNGELIWRSERFAKGVTNAFVHNGQLMVASGKELYNLNPNDGAEKYEVSVKEDDIKFTEQIFKLGENAILVCTKGVSSHAISDGKKNWSVRTKKGDLTEVTNGMAFYANDNGDKVVIDLSNGKYTIYDARKGSTAISYDDGQFMLIVEKDKVSKLKTKE
jgi:outer membrane protein assembly factor BamB